MMFGKRLSTGAAALAFTASQAHAHPGAHLHPHDLAHVGSDLGMGLGAALLIFGVCVLAHKYFRQR
ncbi:MAG: hypothetical protein AAF221_05850 [Pseudomonadota bacterium]